MLKRQLTLKDGIPLAFGSIIGSGILFLPSLTYSLSGAYTFWVWIITTIICIPLTYIFSDMVKHVPDESGIEGFITAGLGRNVGGSIPLLLLGTVSLGMPSSALIVGEYVRNFMEGGLEIQLIIAFIIVMIGIFINLASIKTSAIIQLIITLSIIFVSIALLIFVKPHFIVNEIFVYSNQMTTGLIPGILMAFWAFAGFENLTFIAGEFKNPVRDLKYSMFIALFLSGLLYLLLSESCASHILQAKINSIAGLYQLAEIIPSKNFATLTVTIFAFVAVQINFNSWIWGISRLIYSSAKSAKFPAYFSYTNEKHIPVKAIYLLAFLFFITLLMSILFPLFIKKILVVVSVNFVFIYFLCMISYISLKQNNYYLKLTAILLSIFFFVLLVYAKWIIMYPVILLLAGVISVKFNFYKERIC